VHPFQSKESEQGISVTGVIRALGYGNSILSIATSAILALILFFYIYTVGSFFKANIYILHHRVSYNTFFDFFIINRNIDHIIIAIGTFLWLVLSLKGKARIIISVTYGGIVIIAVTTGIAILLDITALIAIPVVIFSLTYNKFSSKKILNAYTKLTINYMGAITIALGIMSIGMSLGVVFSFPPSLILPIPNYMYEIFVLLSGFSTILMLLLVSSLPVKILIKEFMVGLSKIKNIRMYPIDFSNENVIKLRIKIIYLALFMLLSVVMVLIPHQPIFSNDNGDVGVDTHYYVNWVGALINSSSAHDFARQAFMTQNGGDRPITLIFLFTLYKVVPGNLVDTIEYAPILLSPALVFVVYLLTRELTSNDLTSLLAAFLTAVSFHTMIGIYAGFYSNWLALSIAYLSLVFLFKFLKKSSVLNLAIYSLTIMILQFTHVYTWSIFVIVTCTFLICLIKFNHYRKSNIFLLLIVVFASVVVDIAKLGITGSSSGMVQDLIIANSGGLGPEQFAQRWSNIINTVQNWYGTQFSNFIILLLGLFWLCFTNFRKPASILLVIFLSIGLAAIFFGLSGVQSRILYDIPFQIPAAISLSYIKRLSNGAIISLAICTWLITISIRAVMNFHFQTPT